MRAATPDCRANPVHPLDSRVRSSSSRARQRARQLAGLIGRLLPALWLGPSALLAAGPGSEVVVVYNAKLPESKAVAEYYAQRREVPKEQIFGLPLPTGETMTRQEYLAQLQDPLLRKLEEQRLFTLTPDTNGPANGHAAGKEKNYRALVASRIRYAVLCYGVPTKILKDPDLVEEAAARMPPQIQRNEAAVDTQLALLPVLSRNIPWTGPVASPFYGSTNAAAFQPTNGILMVTRLDGPSPEIARGLVDKAMDAETNGLWGRAYFDARGLGTNDPYWQGDSFIRGAANFARQYGFETELDTNPATFSAGHPFSQVALYAGWYDQTVTGPFTRPTVEFMPGAFAYHLYSFSAATLRSATNSWVGTLLQKGATCTIGFVDEPYLMGTPDIATFLSRFLFLGFSFGEAAYAAQGSLSWQTTVVGDPLYRPCATPLQELHQRLEQRRSKLLEWSHLLVANRNAAIGAPPGQIIGYLESVPIHRQSAVLTEKLADLYWAKGSLSDGIDSDESALLQSASPQQRLRLLLACAEKRSVFGPDAKAYAHYETILKEYPDYPNPDALLVYQAMLTLAKRLNNPVEVTRCEKEIRRLTPPPPAPTPSK